MIWYNGNNVYIYIIHIYIYNDNDVMGYNGNMFEQLQWYVGDSMG